MLVTDAPNVTVGTFYISRMLYMLSAGDVDGGGPHLDGPCHPVAGSVMVVSKGGCVVNGVLANCPAFALPEATSDFLSDFSSRFVPTAVYRSLNSGGCCLAGGEADRCFLPAAIGPASLS
jgi:hypothetical protein